MTIRFGICYAAKYNNYPSRQVDNFHILTVHNLHTEAINLLDVDSTRFICLKILLILAAFFQPSGHPDTEVLSLKSYKPFSILVASIRN